MADPEKPLSEDNMLSEEKKLSEIVRQLNHDLRSPLSTIANGIEALRALKHDPAQVDMLLTMMSDQGVDEIKRILDEL